MQLNRNYILAALFICISCTTAFAQKSFDYGTIKDNVYSNEFFGFEITLPETWIVVNKEEMKAISEATRELITGDDKVLKAAMKASEINSAKLLTAFKYEIGSPVDYNPGIAVMTENLKNYQGIKSGGDYLFNVRKFLRQSEINYTYTDETFSKEMIGGHEFYKMNVEIEIMGKTVKQIYYVTIINRFAISMIYCFMGADQKMELMIIKDSLKFKQ